MTLNSMTAPSISKTVAISAVVHAVLLLPWVTDAAAHALRDDPQPAPTVWIELDEPVDLENLNQDEGAPDAKEAQPLPSRAKVHRAATGRSSRPSEPETVESAASEPSASASQDAPVLPTQPVPAGVTPVGVPQNHGVPGQPTVAKSGTPGSAMGGPSVGVAGGRRGALRAWRTQIRRAVAPKLAEAKSSRLLRRIRAQGSLILALRVQPSGKIVSARVHRSSGHPQVDALMQRQVLGRMVPRPPATLEWPAVWNRAELTLKIALETQS